MAGCTMTNLFKPIRFNDRDELAYSAFQAWQGTANGTVAENAFPLRS
jgi:hypothetical protein